MVVQRDQNATLRTLRCGMEASDMARLREDGFAVVRGVFCRDTCLQWRDRLLRDEDEQHAHSDTMWDIRTRRQAFRRLFETVWGTADLAVSFDGASVRRGHEEHTLDWHVDQNHFHGPELACVQGLVALSECDARTGGTQFLRGSHREHAEAMERMHPDATDDEWEFYPVEEGDPILRLPVAHPCLRPGDVLLWDSRTFHRVVAATDAATERVVAFVCMTPKSFASEETRASRRDAYCRGAATTHWPHKFVDRDDCLGEYVVRDCFRRRALV